MKISVKVSVTYFRILAILSAIQIPYWLARSLLDPNDLIAMTFAPLMLANCWLLLRRAGQVKYRIKEEEGRGTSI